jgi:hypothetical protein
MKQVKITISINSQQKNADFPLTSPRIIKQITLVEERPHENSQNTPKIVSFKKCAPLVSAKNT